MISIHEYILFICNSAKLLILNKINSAKFYIGKRYLGVKTNDFSQEIMFFDSPI